MINLEYEWKNNLQFVRIYFDTPTIDKITKDRAAKEALWDCSLDFNLFVEFRVVHPGNVLHAVTLGLLDNQRGVV